MAKKITAILLLALMLLGSVSCAGGGDKPTGTTAGSSETTAPVSEEESETRLYPNIPTEGVSYDGYEFRFLHWYHTSWDSRRNKDIYAESENGDVINDAVLKRNRTVEERYNMTVSLTEEELGNIGNIVRNNVANGDHVYDVVYGRMTDMSSIITEGNFLDLNLLGYVDFTQPWWDQSSVDSLTIAGKLYLVATDLNIIDKDATAAIAFNKEAAASNNLENFYDVVNNGKWTMDYLMGCFKNISRDLDGNQIMDENDFWAFLGKSDVLMSFFEGAGGRFCTKDENGLPVLSFATEKNINITNKIFEIIFDKDNFINQHTTASLSEDSVFEQLFPNGHGLFYWMRLDCVTQMRATDTDFGILPTPKYDEAQENYGSYVSIHTSGLLSVPVTAAKDQETLDRTGLILEALSAESKYTLMPAYYETALKTKGTRDNESEAMLDIIFANRTFDIGDIFGFGGMASNYQTLANSTTANIASFAERQAKSAQKAIDRFITKIEG